MAKPFQLPDWRKRLIREKYRRKDRVIQDAVSRMERAMLVELDASVDRFINTGHYFPPTLNVMFSVSENFYRSVITAAFHSAQDEKHAQTEKRRVRMARAKGPVGIPRTFRELEKVFRDRRYWPKIMKRSEILTERLRKQYLAKLKKKFDKLGPKLKDGEITPDEIRGSMRDTWHASKPRVETIFRTETTNYFGRTQVAFFKGDPEIIGFLFDSVRDTSRTEICRSRHGLVYRSDSKLLTENTPGLHWNCRSHLIALANTPHNRILVDDPQRDPSRRSVAPLPPGWRK